MIDFFRETIDQTDDLSAIGLIKLVQLIQRQLRTATRDPEFPRIQP
jgi:hypothetical protein